MPQTKLIADVTVRHLQATMTMDWQAPLTSPNQLQDVRQFDLPDGLKSFEAIASADPKGFGQVKTRCGSHCRQWSTFAACLMQQSHLRIYK